MNFSIEHLLADVPHWRLRLVGLKFVASMERSFKKKFHFLNGLTVSNYNFLIN
jgi:hypothetical protein